ncbi:hypothetical protein BDP81DRAFT_145046 [Colletotrichum phormii]|uniref:Uncharacterized protein n=1 Tax=Colletotrichum phormii TaxID=359342 RepID=A0AAI9ZDQ0_9PEZI|nr:uncharacterized protein BDP81DRAFT_145046 [Colletotrichum phormii]KAK1622640.1 hypothetical protein BDP81DRAFT_145046 [Colletotrichum phormii]
MILEPCLFLGGVLRVLVYTESDVCSLSDGIRVFLNYTFTGLKVRAYEFAYLLGYCLNVKKSEEGDKGLIYGLKKLTNAEN